VNSVVIDASVAAKWFLPSVGEAFSEEAADLLERYSRGEIGFLVPDLFWAELANIFWKAIRQHRWSHSDGTASISAIRQQKIPTVAAKTLLEDAFEIATAFDRSLYDSLYVALAIASKTHFLTADERLANALAARLPVKWLGSLS
jgi:predicted nucleic acid-binding protein